MNKIEFRNNLIDPNTKFLAFQPKNYSRQYNKSKSNKKSHQINKNLLSPCQPLGDKLLKAAIQKNQRRIANHNRRQKTQQSMLQNSMIIDKNESRCFNHPDKKGQYFLQSHPNKKFCLKCNISLNCGDNSTFVTKQKHHKKYILDQFKAQLSELKQNLCRTTQKLHQSIHQSQQIFSQHSSYINQSFLKIKQQLEEKRRELMNNLILAQQNLKKTYEDNLKRVKKMTKSLDRYDFDIKKFYQEIIQELPKIEFDQVMQEYEDKISRNIKLKLKAILTQDGICLYIPNAQIAKTIQKANVQFYQPVGFEASMPNSLNKSQQNLQHLTVEKYLTKDNQKNQIKKNGSNSLDSKINELVSNINFNSNRPNTSSKIAVNQKRKENVQLSLFQKKPAIFSSTSDVDKLNQHNDYLPEFNKRLIEDKENINLQNYNTHDYFNKSYQRNETLGKFTFKC